ncbi:bacillithiol biosynthesis deacetylase BshB2 [Salisediminibacterium selenitireducens]|uniref:LmbE family protein n=1 Tax=Bacillus selenitireducens (strain ATCC 700615 / DSM 15326 / MLS10) TaxID=439292 RepID=D6Y1D8_BACIE|nr:bacillithiol biosynthesis deacetylase BshB2 [Salisediminibacterium selenitireducens]ADI00725.1 LmbE family protein [[Bacillus] selenitireducens MLS10]
MGNQHLLVVLPHPDDEAFGVAGTILSHKEAGHDVTYICLTLGEMGRNMGNPLIANRESLFEVRKTELEEACRLLGIEDLRRFGMRDKTVEFADQDALVERIFDVIEEVRPSTIISFYPGFAVHPDHDATGLATALAVKKLPAEERPVFWAIAFKEGCEAIIGEPDIERDVRPFADRKLDVIAAHKSQTAGVIDVLKEQYKEESDDDIVRRMTTERFWTLDVDQY